MKYRIWDSVTNQYIVELEVESYFKSMGYLPYVNINGILDFLYEYHGEYNTFMWYSDDHHDIDRFIIEEFTGILDSCGKEIYVGDILSSTEDLPNDCIYDDVTTYTRYGVVEKRHGYYTHDDDDDRFGLIMNTDNKGMNGYVTIAGNVHHDSLLIKN